MKDQGIEWFNLGVSMNMPKIANESLDISGKFKTCITLTLLGGKTGKSGFALSYLPYTAKTTPLPVRAHTGV